MSEFKPGDLVRHRTGGPVWMVTGRPSDGSLAVYAERVTDDGVERATFADYAIEKHVPAPQWAGPPTPPLEPRPPIPRGDVECMHCGLTEAEHVPNEMDAGVKPACPTGDTKFRPWPLQTA